MALYVGEPEETNQSAQRQFYLVTCTPAFHLQPTARRHHLKIERQPGQTAPKKIKRALNTKPFRGNAPVGYQRGGPIV